MKLTPFKLICLIFVVSLCLGNQYGVSARSNAQDLIETISPPLSPDLTWEYLGNVKKVAFSMGGTLTLSGEMYEAPITGAVGSPVNPLAIK